MPDPVVIFRTHSDVEAAVVLALLDAHDIEASTSSDVPHAVFPLSVDGPAGARRRAEVKDQGPAGVRRDLEYPGRPPGYRPPPAARARRREERRPPEADVAGRHLRRADRGGLSRWWARGRAGVRRAGIRSAAGRHRRRIVARR